MCSCGRSFPGPGPLNFHKRTCQSSKKRLHGALAKVKELWRERKRPRMDSDEPVSSRISEMRTDGSGHSLEIVRSPSLFLVPTSDFQGFNFQSQDRNPTQYPPHVPNTVGIPHLFGTRDVVLIA